MATLRLEWNNTKPPAEKKEHDFGDITGRTLHQVRRSTENWIGPNFRLGLACFLNGESMIPPKPDYVFQARDRLTLWVEYAR